MVRNVVRALIVAFVAAPLLAAAQNPGPIDTPPMAIGTLRPPLDFVTMNGAQHPNWNALRGKIVVVEFWATWCTPCIADFPRMNALHDQFANKGVAFYSVTYEKPGAVTAMLARHPLTTEVGLDNDFHTYKAFNAWGIPVAYIFDREGRLVISLHPDDLNAGVLEAVLAGRKPSAPQAKEWSDPAGAEKYFRSLRDAQMQ